MSFWPEETGLSALARSVVYVPNFLGRHSAPVRVILEPIKRGRLEDFDCNEEEFLDFAKIPRTSYWEYSDIPILSSSEFNTTTASDLPLNLVQGS